MPGKSPLRNFVARRDEVQRTPAHTAASISARRFDVQMEQAWGNLARTSKHLSWNVLIYREILANVLS